MRGMLPRGVCKSKLLAGGSGELLFAEVGDFGVAYRGDVAAGDKELHDFCAVASELGPAGGRCRILLEAADTLASKIEIDLGELAFCSVLYWVGIVAEGDALLAFYEDLAPDGEEGVV